MDRGARVLAADGGRARRRRRGRPRCSARCCNRVSLPSAGPLHRCARSPAAGRRLRRRRRGAAARASSPSSSPACSSATSARRSRSESDGLPRRALVAGRDRRLRRARADDRDLLARRATLGSTGLLLAAALAFVIRPARRLAAPAAGADAARRACLRRLGRAQGRGADPARGVRARARHRRRATGSTSSSSSSCSRRCSSRARRSRSRHGASGCRCGASSRRRTPSSQDGRDATPVRDARRLDSDGMSPFRRRQNEVAAAEVEGASPRAGRTRACSAASRRCCCAPASRSCATSAGWWSRCTGAAPSARTCSQERCADAVGIDARLAEIDDLLHGERHAPRCECGAPILRGSHFCPNCGRRARRDAAATAPRTRMSSCRRGKREARDRLPATETLPPLRHAPASRTRTTASSCGLRLPPSTGRVAALRRGWLRRFGWYPGDWIWVGAARRSSSRSPVRRSRSRSPTKARRRRARRSSPRRRRSREQRAAAARRRRCRGTRAARRPTGTTRARPRRAEWPRHLAGNADGWTIVLVSYPRDTRRGGAPRRPPAGRRRPRPSGGRRARLVRLLEPPSGLRDRLQRHLQLPRPTPKPRSRARARRFRHRLYAAKSRASSCAAEASTCIDAGFVVR